MSCKITTLMLFSRVFWVIWPATLTDLFFSTLCCLGSEATNPMQIMFSVLRGTRPDTSLDSLPADIPCREILLHLMTSGWAANPDERPSFLSECRLCQVYLSEKVGIFVKLRQDRLLTHTWIVCVCWRQMLMWYVLVSSYLTLTTEIFPFSKTCEIQLICFLQDFQCNFFTCC